MSLVNAYESITKPKIKRATMMFANDIKNVVSANARSTAVTGTWDRSIQVFPDGDDFVIAPSIGILQSNPAFKSTLPNGDYTVMFTEHKSGWVANRTGLKVELPKNPNVRPIGSLINGKRIADYL